MTRLAPLAALLLLFALTAVPAQALPGNLAEPDISVLTTDAGNIISWEYPDGVMHSKVDYVEVWRFDGLESGQLVANAKGKHPQFTDTESNERFAYYTLRYVMKDGQPSDYSLAKSGAYPYCGPIFIISPQIAQPLIFQGACVFPLPYTGPAWEAAMELISGST
ncbi:MAG: hypothetical protein AABX89_08605 [Candidatus Thermoplasmatota archaeon]